MPTLDTLDGTPLWFDVRGAGRPLVLLQGLQFPAGFFWGPVAERLEARHRIILLDLRGQGLSGKPAHGHTIAQNAADLAHAIDTLDARGAVVCGVAFGGMVALRMVLDHGPGRLRGLCLSEMTPRLTNADGWAHPTFGDFPVEAAAGFGAGVRAARDSALGGFLDACFATPPSPETRAQMRAQTWLTPTDTVAALIDDMASEDTRDALPRLTLPVQLIYGRRNNPVMPGEVGRWMQARIPGSELVELDAAGHSPFWDDPDGFAAALDAFASRT
jgi:pimeloyl-ACP methyl ester carboxylesterase